MDGILTDDLLPCLHRSLVSGAKPKELSVSGDAGPHAKSHLLVLDEWIDGVGAEPEGRGRGRVN